LIKRIEEPSVAQKISMLRDIVEDFNHLMSHYSVPKFYIEANYPYIKINNLTLDVKQLTYEGEHDEVTDAFRDFIRRYGIRIFAPQGFLFKLNRK
jgi:hypothetical protein